MRWFTSVAAAVFCGLSVASALAEDKPTAVEEIPPAVRGTLRVGIFVEKFISDRLALLRQADLARDGLDAADLDRQRMKAAAAARTMRLVNIFANDADGNARVTRDEIRVTLLSQRSLDADMGPSTQKYLEDVVERLMRADLNGDDVITVEEVVQSDAAMPDRSAGSVDILQTYLSFDPNKDGKLTVDELTAVARAWFATIDVNGDGYFDRGEAAVLAQVPKPLLRVNPDSQCILPMPDPNDLIVAYGVYEGTAVSTVAVAGLDADTRTLRVTIEPGTQPIYLVLSAYDPMIWQIEGARDRVSRVVLMSRRITPTGATAAGVTGVNRAKVVFAPQTCRFTFYDTDGAKGAQARGMIGRAVGGRADVQIKGVYAARAVALPSGTIDRSPTHAPVPAGFDPDTWNDSLRFNPGGLQTIDPVTVVSEEPAVAYDVLPQQAGLAQLVGSGSLVRLPGRNAFKIVKPISRYPASLGGAHAVRFLLAKGVPAPGGDPVHSCVVSEETGLPLSGRGVCP